MSLHFVSTVDKFIPRVWPNQYSISCIWMKVHLLSRRAICHWIPTASLSSKTTHRACRGMLTVITARMTSSTHVRMWWILPTYARPFSIRLIRRLGARSSPKRRSRARYWHKHRVPLGPRFISFLNPSSNRSPSNGEGDARRCSTPRMEWRHRSRVRGGRQTNERGANQIGHERRRQTDCAIQHWRRQSAVDGTLWCIEMNTMRIHTIDKSILR